MKKKKARKQEKLGEWLHCMSCLASVDVGVYPMALTFHNKYPEAQTFPVTSGVIGMFHKSPACSGKLAHVFYEVPKRKAKR